MSDRDGGVSVEAAQALLDSLREVKDDFCAIDAAVANHLRDGRERVGRSRIRRRTFRACRWAAVGQGAVLAVATASGEIFDIGVGVTTQAQLITASEPTMTGMLIGALAGQVSFWRTGMEHKAVAAEAAERCDGFLFAGVAAELALGELGTTLDDARRGRPSSGEELASKVTEAQEALERYVHALQRLDENDVAIRFPWSTREIDITIARELLAVNAEAVLAQIGLPTTDMATLAGLPGPRRRELDTSTSTGGVGALLAAAEAARGELEATAHALHEIEDTIRQTARQRADADTEALQRLAGVVAQSQRRGSLLVADCLSIENAARSMIDADTVPQALDDLTTAPSAAHLRNALDGYASSLEATVHQLTAANDDGTLPDAGAVTQITWNDVRRLASVAHTLAESLDAVETGLNEFVTS